MKAARIESNKAGKRYALVLDARMGVRSNDETYGVWAESINYCGHVANGLRKSWRYCKIRISLEEAEALFAKKLAGKARP